MSIIESIEAKKNSCDNNQKLWQVTQEIVKDVIEHSKQIASQMTDYDIHDERHSEQVLEIMNQLLGDIVNELSFYELILLYLSAYLHDSGMALATWEYKALKAVEGNETFNDSSLRFFIRNDFKPVQNTNEIIKLVQESSLLDYETAQNYIFIASSELEEIEKIAALIREYEVFRNNYSTKLKHFNTAPDYMEFSELLRSEFIRINHHKKAASNIENLKRKIETAIDRYNTETICNDLASICQAHGESLDYIKELPKECNDWENNKYNIQFLAEILRLADIIHFSSDRAPLSLYAEKQITNKESLKHWKVKFQDVNYKICKEENKKTISFSAFCETPEMYYFLNSYIDGIDNEITNYYTMKYEWDRLKENAKYNLNIHPSVIRVDIKYDSTNFTPDRNLKFTLDQSRILDLLMGVQLYKDKFACLREVYQNALDTSKCILAYNKTHNITEELSIEFGIDEEIIDGVNRKYIYCLDHGLGMNKHIINSFLLHIGNSYYKSRDFDANNTQWGFDVKPTSQFGIGILSCYMIADKIGITTVYYEDRSKISLVLSGVSENCYYKKLKTSDEEKIGNHGTIVKLYLKEKYISDINNESISKMPLLLMINNDEDIALFGDVKKIKNNLVYILFQYVGITHPGIPVYVNTSDNKHQSIYQYNQIFDYTKYDGITHLDIETLIRNYHFFDGHNPYKQYIDNIDYLQNYLVETKTDNISLYTLITLPKKGITSSEERIFHYGSFIGNRKSEICVDGISVNNHSHSQNILITIPDDILHCSIINYKGTKKPLLSIDRTTCISFPELNLEEHELLSKNLLTNLEAKIQEHILSEGIKNDSQEYFLLYDYLCKHFPSLASQILIKLTESLAENISIPDINNLKVNDLIHSPELQLEKVNFTEYHEVSRQLILSKCISPNSIEIIDDNINIQSSCFEKIPRSPYSFDDNTPSLSSCVIRADKWTGRYQDYDMVSSLWPIINPLLFDCLSHDFENGSVTKHCKHISPMGNGIHSIASLDPTLINPSFGIGIKEKKAFKHDELFLNQPDKIERGYWLFELSNHSKMEYEQKKSPTLYAYIKSRLLSDKEEIALKQMEEKDPDFVNGVRNGWSIYFFGKMSDYFILPGIVSRKEMESSIPERIKSKKEDLSYINTLGEIVL